MKDGVDGSEGIGELRGEGMGASLSDDVIGTKILFRELLQETSGSEMFGFDKYLISDLKIWCQRSVFVGGDLVSFLSIGCWVYACTKVNPNEFLSLILDFMLLFHSFCYSDSFL